MQVVLASTVVVPLHAQSSASASLAITAQVVSPLTLAVTHPLDFGRILTASSKTVAPNAAAAGQFELFGQGGSAVTVTLSMPATLNPPAGAGLPITDWRYLVGDSPALTGTPVSFNSGGSGPIAAMFRTFAGTTKLYFGIGATVEASALQPGTQYTGTGQITAAYADL